MQVLSGFAKKGGQRLDFKTINFKKVNWKMQGRRVDLSSVPKSCTEYSTMENKFYQKTELTAKARTRNREGLGTSHQNYFASSGRGKMEEEGVWGCEIFDKMQTRGVQTYSFEFLFPQNNPSPSCVCYTATKERQFPKIDKIWKERLDIGHSFIFSSSRGLILILNLVLMTRTQSFSISCSDCQSIAVMVVSSVFW